MRLATLGAIGVALTLVAFGSARAAESSSYTLVTHSTILQYCTNCTDPVGRPEILEGSFSITPITLDGQANVAALTDVHLESRSYKIGGAGFVQFDASGKMQIELKANVNGEELELRSTRRQPPNDGSFTVVLATPREESVGYLIVLKAKAESTSSADGSNPAASVPAADNCGIDSDSDGVGDACDHCPNTPAHAIVNADGCSVDQICPCEGPRDGGEWTRGGYAKCVAGAVRDLRRLGLLSRREAADVVRGALQNGCGQTVIAMM